jgi:hypothetical protein
MNRPCSLAVAVPCVGLTGWGAKASLMSACDACGDWPAGLPRWRWLP